MGWKDPSGACCCCSPRCLLPVLYASPSVSPQSVHLPLGLSEVTRRSPTVILSISNHRPPSSPQVSPMDLQARPPPPTPQCLVMRESERETHTEGQALLLQLPSLTPTPRLAPFRILMNISGKVQKGLEKSLAVPRCCGVILSVFISRACWGDVVNCHTGRFQTEASLLWVGGVGPSTSGLPRRHGQTRKAHNFCYSKPESNVENNTFSLSLKKKEKRGEKKEMLSM